MNPFRPLVRHSAALLRACAILALCALPTAVFAAFGYTDNGTAYVVDSGAGLVFQVRKSDGSVTSLVYNGTEYNGPSGKGSHIASGLGSATTVTPETDGTTYVKITLQTAPTNTVVSSLTQYLIVRNGENTIYMATYATAEPGVGELRWITRLDHSLLPNGPGPSNLNGNTGAIESSDVFGMPDGTTRSKYYGDSVTHGKDRAMDLTYDGATGTNVGVWMIFGNRESSSGGPFFRDIQNQAGTDQEIYNYMNSGHNQTESNRLNVLHGPYALVFTTGAPPAYPRDFSWMGSLNLTGWVSASGRGAVAGNATGIPSAFQGVVGFANASAQYWTTIAADGSYACSGIKPGTYTATLYKGELGVATATVNVTAGATTALDLTSTETTPATIFQIGDWDGTPAGLLNAANIPVMHPSDVRNASWGPVNYVVGTSSPASFPAIQFRGANSPSTITFNLAPNQITALTLRIGITCAYNGGRPSVTINGQSTTDPGASGQPNSRSFTIGTYRGNNALFTYTLPASALVAGTNMIRITPISGSSDLGTWLSAGWVYDAIELDGPIAAPVITYVGGAPVTFAGTAEPGRTVTATIDGTTPAGSTVVAANGTWSIVYGGGLAAAPHTVTAIATDSTGHSGPSSASVTFNSAVTMPMITAAVGDTGTYATGATTSDRVFTLTGSAGPGDSVTVTRTGTGTVGTTVADGSGNWSFDYTSVSLPDGANSFYVTGANGGGTGPSSPVFTLNLSGAPRVAINRFNPLAGTITAAVGNVVFRVTFNAPVSGVTTGAFAVTTTNTAAASVTTVSASSGTVFDVTVGGLSGTGTLRLDLRPGNGILDASNNPEGPYTAGQSYNLVVGSTGSGTWTQAASGGMWSDPQNWLNAVVADGVANAANFATLDVTANNTVHLDSGRTLAGVTFGDTNAATAASWIVDNAGNLANTLTLAGATPTIAVNALGTGATATLSTAVAGTGGLTKAGAGTLVLAAPNTLTGTLNVNAGNLQVSPTATLALGNSAVNTGLNSQLMVEGGSFSTTGLVTAVTSSVVVDSGTATLGSFRTNSDFSGTLRVNGGTLTVGDVNIRRNAGSLTSGTPFASGFVVTGGVANTTTIELGTNNSWGTMSLEGGVLNASGIITVANQATSTRGGALRVLNNATFNSTETSLGIVMCRNTSTNGNNVAQATFTGGVSTIEKFTLGYDATVNAGSATITVNGGTLYLGSGGIVKNGASGLATALNFTSGTVGAKADWSTAVPITLPSGGNIVFKAADASDNPFGITLNGAVGGAGGFTKAGDGALKLDGGVTHTFTGFVAVNGGTLQVTTALGSATNAITVNAGAELSGNATLNRPVVLNAGGTLAPDGAAPAVLNASTITWNGAGTVALNLAGNGSSDQIAASGTFTKGAAGTYSFALTPVNGFAIDNIYTLATFGSTNFTAADFSATGLPAGSGALFVVTPTSLQLVVQGVPSITSNTSGAGTYGAPFAFAVTATEMPATFTATGLPPGLTLDSVSGAISGTPTAAGTFVANVTAANTAGATSSPLTITIAKAPAGISAADVAVTYDGNAHAVPVTTSPAGLNVVVTYNGSATPPTHAGNYTVSAVIADANYAGSTSGALTIAKAAPTIAVTPYAVMYDGNPHTATGTATGVKGEALAGLALSATTHTNAGTFANDGWTFTDPNGNYTAASGSVSDSIAKANPTVSVTPYSVTYDQTAHTATGTAKGVKGEALAGLDLTGTTHTNAGSYTDVWAFADVTGNYLGATGTITDKISPAASSITLSGLAQMYDGAPKPVTATTTPAGLTVDLTYAGNTSAPTLPGNYPVVATINDPNYTGTTNATLTIGITALVRHAPVMNADIDGSLQVLLGESIVLNGSAGISGDLLTPGVPAVQLNGHPTFAGTKDAAGTGTPTNYTVTLNGGALLRYLVRRVDPISLPAVAAPPSPAGTRDVVINSAGQPVGDFATLRDLTLNGNVGPVVLPPGTYRNLTVNGGSTVVLGTADATEPVVYNLQNLTLNGGAHLTLAGPVLLTLANGVTLNASVGSSTNPGWLTLQIAGGGVTLNGNVTLYGHIVAPNGTATFNGSSVLHGTVTADRLILNGSSVLITAP